MVKATQAQNQGSSNRSDIFNIWIQLSVTPHDVTPREKIILIIATFKTQRPMNVKKFC